MLMNFKANPFGLVRPNIPANPTNPTSKGLALVLRF